MTERRALLAAAAGALPARLGLVGALAGCAGPARPPPPLPAQASANVVLTAMAFLDVPYRLGGNGGGDAGALAADGFDCSGFTRHVYERSLGLTLPRTAWDQARSPALLAVAAHQLEAGDLVFFNTLRRAHSHVGVYIGEGRFIHAPRVGALVRLEDLQGPAGRWWTERLDGVRRPAPGPLAGAAR